jgi:hypothetical protein
MCGSSPIGRAVLLAPLALVLACVTETTGVYMVEDPPTEEELHKILFLPMNFDSAPPAAYLAGTEIVSERLITYLQECGHDVSKARLSEVMSGWQKAIDQVGGLTAADGQTMDEERYELARVQLVRRLLAAHPADGVLMPTLFIREGRINGTNLRWDGVSRPIPIYNVGTNAPVANVVGKDRGTSIRISVFDESGRMVFERYAGIEPITKYRITGGGLHKDDRRDLFQDESILSQSIRVSLTPLIDPPDSKE